MTQPADLIWATIVQGPDPIPATWQPYIGRFVGLSQEVWLAISTDPANPSKFRGLFGYRRAGAGGENEIALVPPLTVAAQNFIRDLPAPQTWPAGEETKLRQIAVTLAFDFQVPPAVVRDAFQQIFDSTRLLPPA